MNNKKFKKILTMHMEGISAESCALLILEYCEGESNLVTGTWIHKFYDKIHRIAMAQLAQFNQTEVDDMEVEKDEPKTS